MKYFSFLVTKISDLSRFVVTSIIEGKIIFAPLFIISHKWHRPIPNQKT
jgi:hypothetical protein